MTRNRASAKKAGTQCETDVAKYLANTLDDDRIERRTRNGRLDRGDIGGLRVHGQRLVVECKDTTRHDLSGWIREAHTEAANDDALLGVVVAKRRGTTQPGDYYVFMELRDLVALITGTPQESRYE